MSDSTTDTERARIAEAILHTYLHAALTAGNSFVLPGYETMRDIWETAELFSKAGAETRPNRRAKPPARAVSSSPADAPF